MEWEEGKAERGCPIDMGGTLASGATNNNQERRKNIYIYSFIQPLHVDEELAQLGKGMHFARVQGHRDPLARGLSPAPSGSLTRQTRPARMEGSSKEEPKGPFTGSVCFRDRPFTALHRGSRKLAAAAAR